VLRSENEKAWIRPSGSNLLPRPYSRLRNIRPVAELPAFYQSSTVHSCGWGSTPRAT
jgi:hypothetical protein